MEAGTYNGNDFPNELSTNIISEWNQFKYKGHNKELICITIQLLMSSITPLNQMQKD